MKKIKWEKIPEKTSPFGGTSGGNYVTYLDGGYISYQPERKDNLLEDIAEMLTGDSTKSDETALYDGDKWRVLWGDHREAYEQVIPKGMEACVELYKKLKPEHGAAKWSSG